MSRFQSKLESQTISTILTRLENKEEERIILNPQYQRNVIWSINDMSYFLNSVYNNIIPNSILFNVDGNGNYVCMDGKQRLSSLQFFKNNRIPLIITESDGETETYVFYSSILELYAKKYKNCREMTQIEKNKFNVTPIPIVTYTNLDYAEQTEIFYRIQHGKVLSSGEIFMSLFSKDDAQLYFSKFCDSKQHLICPNTERKEHVIDIVDIRSSD